MTATTSTDIAVVGWAHTPLVRHTEQSEVQLLLEVITDAITPLGLTRADIDFTCLGSCDYITGQAFSPFNWSESDFVGQVGFHQVGATLALGDAGFSLVLMGAFEFYGAGRFPSIKIPVTSGTVAGIAAGAGIDLERDILAHLPFKPAIEGPRAMDATIFKPQPMGLRERMLDIRIGERHIHGA